MNKTQRTLDEANLEAHIQAVINAPHGYKEKAKERLRNLVNEMMKRDTASKKQKRAA